MRVGCLLKDDVEVEEFANAIEESKSRAYKQNTVYIDNENRYFVVKKHEQQTIQVLHR